jgi:hypothetical protein
MIFSVYQLSRREANIKRWEGGAALCFRVNELKLLETRSAGEPSAIKPTCIPILWFFLGRLVVALFSNSYKLEHPLWLDVDAKCSVCDTRGAETCGRGEQMERMGEMCSRGDNMD